MKDFLDFNLPNLYGTDDALKTERIIDRLLFYDNGKKQRRLLDDIRYLRMLHFLYCSEISFYIDLDFEIIGCFLKTIDRTVNLFKFSDEIDDFIDIDIEFLKKRKSLLLMIIRQKIQSMNF